MSVVELESHEIALEAPSGLWRDAWYRVRHNPGAIVGFCLVGLFVLVALAAPLVAPAKRALDESSQRQTRKVIRNG